MTSEAILTELRALPGAPDRLRERVRSLPEPKPRIAWTPPHVARAKSSSRRSRLSYGAAHSLVTPGSPKKIGAVAPQSSSALSAGTSGASRAGPGPPRR